MTADQQSAEHRVPGESLSGRLSARGGVARGVGPSDAFYARFGLRSPWSPEGPVGGFGRDMDLVYLSSAAFFDSMSRLVDRREQRVNRLFGSRSLRKRRDISALRRAGVGPRSFTGWHGIDLLGESDMVVPVEPLAEAAGDAEAVSAGPSRPRGPSMRPVASPWLSFESKPARVFGGTHRSTSQGATGSTQRPSLTKAPTADAGPTLASASAQRADSVRASQGRVVPGLSLIHI